MSNNFGLCVIASSIFVMPLYAGEVKEAHPNIVMIYVDDLGYGDISCQSEANGRTIQTPNIDRLAKEGMRFTSAYAAASTCTPSRYSLLTGEYPFRKQGTGVLPGDAHMIIHPGRQTLAGNLASAGYRTAVVGKWHLGLGVSGALDWNKPIKAGPQQIGFDYSYILPATNDRVPFVFLENQQVVNADPNDPIQVSYHKKVGNDPTGRENPNLLRWKYSHGHDGTIINGVSRIGFMSGGNKARLKDEFIPEMLLQKSESFIAEAQKEGAPFFLYFSTIDIHVPRVPHPDFLGKSSLGPRGDVILQLDWTVGKLYDMLKQRNLLENTIIIFTSDNGPFLDDGYVDEAIPLAQKHRYDPAGGLNGHKYCCFEGGARVPFIVRYPKEIAQGKVSNAMISQVDLLASLSALVGVKVDAQSAPDSQNMLDALFGKDSKGRETLLFQATNGPVLRHQKWKYWNLTNNGYFSPRGQAMYDLEKDPKEKVNLINDSMHKEVKNQLETIYRQTIKGNLK